MAEKMEIRGTGQPTDTMMTITDPDGERFLVFDKAIFPYLELGKIIEVEVKRDVAKKSGDGTYNLIQSITVDGKVIGGKAKTSGRSYGKSDKELAQIRQLAEAQNRSIQAQTALNRAVDLAIAENFDMPCDIKAIKQVAKEFYQALQSLTLISEAKVIHKEIKEAKGETNKDTTGGQEAQTEPTDRQDSREATEPKTVGEFLTWLTNHDIKAPRAWLEVEYKVSNTKVLTIKKCSELYKTIKKDKGW